MTEFSCDFSLTAALNCPSQDNLHMEVTRSIATLFVRTFVVGMLATLMFVTVVDLWPRLSFWHEHRLAMRLVERLQGDDDTKGREVLKQIAGIGDPAIEALVLAAASEHADLALIAQEIIEARVSSWRLQADPDKSLTLARSAGLLAGALANHVGHFGSFGKQWAQRLSLEIVEMAADFPAELSISTLADCNKVMDSVPTTSPRMRADLGVNQIATPESTVPVLPAVRLSPWQEGNEDGNSDDQEGIGRVSETTIPHMTPSNPEVEENKQPSPFTPQWSQPVLVQELPPPLQVEEKDKRTLRDPEEVVIAVPSPDEMAAQVEILRDRDTRSLLVELQSADQFRSGTIRAALAERGISRAELPLAVKLLSKDTRERLTLVDDLKVLPASTARRWLRELLNDDDAEVRLRALTNLATTKDPQLPAIARELAVLDPDSRVTELAGKIARDAR